MEQRLDDEGEDHHDGRDGEDHEDRGAVAAVGKAQIEPAVCADRRNLQEAREQCRPSPQRGQRQARPAAKGDN